MKPPFDFFGGLFFQDNNKHKSSNDPIATLPIPKTLVIPLQQHAGSPCRPTVEVGKHVKRDEIIGYSGQDISVGVHASTSGTIKSIQNSPVAHPSGIKHICMVLDSDGLDEGAPPTPLDWEKYSLNEVLLHLQRMGIAGLGGGAFPSHVKMKSKIHTLVINCAECEPYITCDDILTREEAIGILEGADIVHRLLNSKTLLLGIEDNKPEALDALKKAKLQLSSPVEIIVTPTKYPTGAAKQLIKCLTNVEIPHGKHTTEYGFQCFNVATLLAIRNALVDGTALTERIVTISGNVSQGKNYRVRLGTTIKDLLLHHNDKLNCQNVIIGGPLMGFYVDDLDSAVIKSTNCILIPHSSWNDVPEEMPCIRCGACAPVCPAKLQPHELYWFARGHQLEKAQDYNLFDCIECGCCSYVCPSHIPLVQYYQYAKDEIRSQQVEKNLAQEAKIRFEFREERKKRYKEERVKRISEQNRERAQMSDEEKRAVIMAAVKKKEEKMAAREKSPPTNSS